MRNARFVHCAGIGLLAALGALGCSGDDGQGPASSGGAAAGGPSDRPGPGFPSNQGQPANGSAGYPPGPYGIAVSSVIENYRFVGFADAARGSGALQPIQLGDFYNPHVEDATYHPAAADDRRFPAGSPYGAGTPKPHVLLIDVASVWCGPCKQEAGSVLPGRHARYKPCGGEFLLQLADSAAPGIPAVQSDLASWTTAYRVDYPATIDPSSKLAALFAAAAFPENLIIDTRTMTIIDAVAGEPDATFWATFEHTMNNPSCLAAHP